MRLIRVEGARLHDAAVDIVDGTPSLDLKLYALQFTDRPAERTDEFAANINRVGSPRAEARLGRIIRAPTDQFRQGMSAPSRHACYRHSHARGKQARRRPGGG